MKQQMAAEILEKLNALGIQAAGGDNADVTVSAELLDAGWSTGSKKISYKASVYLDESSQIVFMWEKTVETGRGLSFGGDSGTSFQSGKTLFRKVKSIQYGPEGKAYEYVFDLGAIPKTVKEIAKGSGWKFKTVLNRAKASYPPGYTPTNAPALSPSSAPLIPPAQLLAPIPVTAQPVTPSAQTAGFCTLCGAPIAVGVNFCAKCGTPFAAVSPVVSAPAAPVPVSTPKTEPPAQVQAVTQPPPLPAKLPAEPREAIQVQSQSFVPKDSPKKPSTAGAVLFWLVWSFLGIMALVMLIDGFSGLRLFGFALILAPVAVFRAKLFKKFLPSLLLWIVILVAFIFVIGITNTDGESIASTRNMTVQTQENVSVAVLDGVLPEGGSIRVNKDPNPPKLEIEEASADVYDISLPPGSEMTGVAQIDLPYDKSRIPSGTKADDALSTAYYNPRTHAWESTTFVVNTDKGVVTVFTDHFSKYAVVYFKDGRKKLAERLPVFDSMSSTLANDSELLKIVNELSSGSDQQLTALAAGWNQFNTYYGLTGATGTILGAAVGSKTLNNINNLMTEVGLGFAFAQIAFDMYNGDSNAAVNNFVKNASFYSASKWGGAAVNLASAGVTFMDIAINKFAEKALDKNLQKWEDAYRHYYQTNPKVKRTAVDWYKTVRSLHQDSSGAADFKAKIDQAITEYADLFWKDAEGYAFVAESTPEIRGFGAGGEYAPGVGEISGRFKQYIYGTTMQPVMDVLMKNLWFEQCRKAEAKLKQLKAEMNKTYTVMVNLAGYGQVADLSGTKVRFKNSGGEAVHSQSFDASGRAGVRMTLFSFLKAGSPTTVEVYVPAQEGTPAYNTALTYQLDRANIVLNAPYVPTGKPKEPAVAKKPVNQSTSPKPTQPTPPTPTPAVEKPTQIAPKPIEPPKPEYNYQAALAAWAADFAAEVNRRVYDDGVCKITSQFEWLMAPIIRDGQVIGASRIWQTTSYYDGPDKGKTTRHVSNEAYDPSNPGVYIYAGELKRKYPQFGQ